MNMTNEAVEKEATPYINSNLVNTAMMMESEENSKSLIGVGV